MLCILRSVANVGLTPCLFFLPPPPPPQVTFKCRIPDWCYATPNITNSSTGTRSPTQPWVGYPFNSYSKLPHPDKANAERAPVVLRIPDIPPMPVPWAGFRPGSDPGDPRCDCGTYLPHFDFGSKPFIGNEVLDKASIAFLKMRKTSYEYDAALPDLVPQTPKVVDWAYIQDTYSYSGTWKYGGDNDTIVLVVKIEPPPPPRGPGDPVRVYLDLDLDKVPFADKVQFQMTREIYRSELYKGFCFDPQPSSPLTGTFNLAPRIKSTTAISGAAGVYGDKTQINIEFDEATLKPALAWDEIVEPVRRTDCGERPMGGDCKALNLGSKVVGRWLQGDTVYRIDVQNASGADAINLGNIQFELKGQVNGPGEFFRIPFIY